jgi:transcriptional regulator with XRE-family HTH domain
MSAPSRLSENLGLVLKLASMSGARLASGLAVNKSVVSRWLNGEARPSAANLTRLTALVAARAPGFSAVDWERDPQSFAALFGVDAGAGSEARERPTPVLPIPGWDEMAATTALRAGAYEGFFRTTRPGRSGPGEFVHDHVMVRRDAEGVLRVRMGNNGASIGGVLIPWHSQIYMIFEDAIGGTMLFAVFNGLGAAKIEAFDGLALVPGFDLTRTFALMAVLCERVGDLSGEVAADDRRFQALIESLHEAPPGSIPEAVQRHLVRDVGPAQLAMGGELLPTMALSRSMTRASPARP